MLGSDQAPVATKFLYVLWTSMLQIRYGSVLLKMENKFLTLNYDGPQDEKVNSWRKEMRATRVSNSPLHLRVASLLDLLYWRPLAPLGLGNMMDTCLSASLNRGEPFPYSSPKKDAVT